MWSNNLFFSLILVSLTLQTVIKGLQQCGYQRTAEGYCTDQPYYCRFRQTCCDEACNTCKRLVRGQECPPQDLCRPCRQKCGVDCDNNPHYCPSGQECCNEINCRNQDPPRCVDPGETCTEGSCPVNECPQTCGLDCEGNEYVCPDGLVCCNSLDCLGKRCVKPGTSCTFGSCPVNECEQCGTDCNGNPFYCPFGLECCNEINCQFEEPHRCVLPGESCTEGSCPVNECLNKCGLDCEGNDFLCPDGLDCCNPLDCFDRRCREPGTSCTFGGCGTDECLTKPTGVACGTDCTTGETFHCPAGLQCCNASCNKCMLMGMVCSQEACVCN